jgi:hypothetical protein
MDERYSQLSANKFPVCENCQITTEEVILHEGPHYSKNVCPKCGKSYGFNKKPENRDKRTTTTKLSVEGHFCYFCLRLKEQLGKREAIEVHHIVELRPTNPEGTPGADSKENIMFLCTACHSLCKHLRIYLNQHLCQKERPDLEQLQMKWQHLAAKNWQNMFLKPENNQNGK